jgi:hypothetical protein
MNDQFKAQQVIENMAASRPPDNSLRPTFDKCSQCGFFHPPLPVGQMCPQAPVKIEGITDQQINQMIAALKNILVSQIQVHKITDGNKLLQELIIHIMKYFEGRK